MEINGKVKKIYTSKQILLGIFVEGIYQSKIQKQLKYEKQLRIMENEILESAREFFNKFEKAFSESDKKTFKENLTPFFAVQDDMKTYFKEPYPKYEERPPEKWFDSCLIYP